MRKTRLLVAAVLICAVAVAGNASVAFGRDGRDGGDGGGGSQEVQVRDSCDAATFNAALGAGACTTNGEVTFAQFRAELNPQDFGDDHWKFNPDTTTINRGQLLNPFNRGGESHTFTEVANFGPGCIAGLNTPLGLTGASAVANCQAALAAKLVPGASVTVSNLSVGTHKFMCAIHPWMRSTITVR
jgi:plastocyanin/predicted small secreted protein